MKLPIISTIIWPIKNLEKKYILIQLMSRKRLKQIISKKYLIYLPAISFKMHAKSSILLMIQAGTGSLDLISTIIAQHARTHSVITYCVSTMTVYSTVYLDVSLVKHIFYRCPRRE